MTLNILAETKRCSFDVIVQNFDGVFLLVKVKYTPREYNCRYTRYTRYMRVRELQKLLKNRHVRFHAAETWVKWRDLHSLGTQKYFSTIAMWPPCSRKIYLDSLKICSKTRSKYFYEADRFTGAGISCEVLNRFSMFNKFRGISIILELAYIDDIAKIAIFSIFLILADLIDFFEW